MGHDIYVKRMTQVLLKILGLDQARDVRVGNEFVRGISGGQRKRVSVAEMLAMRGRLMCWDKYVAAFFAMVFR